MRLGLTAAPFMADEGNGTLLADGYEKSRLDEPRQCLEGTGRPVDNGNGGDGSGDAVVVQSDSIHATLTPGR